MATTTPKRSMSTGVIAVFVLAGLCVLSVPCVGVLSAVAIPAFVGYVRRSKTAEVAPNIRAIRAGIEAYAMSERLDPATGSMQLRGLPRSIPLTPATQGTERRSWPADADPAWSELAFQIPDPFYFSYEVVTNQATGSVTVRAVGDLDGDGVTSEFLVDGQLDPSSGEIAWAPGLVITNELE